MNRNELSIEGAARLERTRIFKCADGEVVSDAALHAIQIHHRNRDRIMGNPVAPSEYVTRVSQ